MHFSKHLAAAILLLLLASCTEQQTTTTPNTEPLSLTDCPLNIPDSFVLTSTEHPRPHAGTMEFTAWERPEFTGWTMNTVHHSVLANNTRFCVDGSRTGENVNLVYCRDARYERQAVAPDGTVQPVEHVWLTLTLAPDRDSLAFEERNDTLARYWYSVNFTVHNYSCRRA